MKKALFSCLMTSVFSVGIACAAPPPSAHPAPYPTTAYQAGYQHFPENRNDGPVTNAPLVVIGTSWEAGDAHPDGTRMSDKGTDTAKVVIGTPWEAGDAHPVAGY